jgi:hypothetical protein
MRIASRMTILVSLFAVLSPHSLAGQSDRPLSKARLPVRETIADAEAEGASYPRDRAPEHVPTMFGAQYPGTGARKCTSGPQTVGVRGSQVLLGYQPTAIRSGEFIIGGQVGAGSPANVGWQSKIWWAPYHNPFEYGTKLLVRGARLGHPGDTIRYERPDYAVPASGLLPTRTSGKKTDSFFPSGITLPRSGRWLLIATAGDDWGCFIIPTKT